MSWFQLDPQSIAERARAAGKATVPSMGSFICRGTIGFLVVSVAGFAPWALAGRWFHRNVGEIGMYIACMAAYLFVSGPLMHRLIIGPGSLSRFYKLFTPAFIVYSIAWIVAWMTLGGHMGSIIGLLAGTAAMGWMLARAFDATSSTLIIIMALFVLNAVGYFGGGWVEQGLASLPPESFGSRRTQMIVAMLSWGVCYGIGFGAGLGLAFYYCQERVRDLLKSA